MEGICFIHGADANGLAYDSFQSLVDWDLKVLATHLRKRGIEPVIIVLLQGRISRSVFVKHHYRPDINEIIASKVSLL